MTMSPPARPEGMTLAQPIPVPMLTVLPPSSDTESWSCSPSPRPLRSDRPHGSHRSRTRTKRRKREEQGCAYKPQWGKTPQIVIQSSTERGAVQHQSPSPSLVTEMGTAKQGRDSPSHDLLIPPSRSWSRSPSPSRRSRWSLRSLLGRDSDGDRCSTASNSPRSTPGSSPSLRRRVLGGGRASENEAGGEKSSSGGGGGAGSDGALPSIPSASSLSSAYPIASRHFSRNAKKMQSWYNVLSPTYKQRNEDFRKIFKKLPDSERLIVDYSCALQKDILLQGRLYLSENWLCFYSNIFRWETTITILLKDVTSMTKEKTAKLIPNAIQISTDNEKHFFTSFGARDRSYMMIFRLWQNALLDKSLSPKELWHIVHQCYGTELGLTSEDDDYVSPTAEHMNGLLPGEESGSVTDLLDLSSVSVPSAGSSPPPLVPCSLSSPPSAASLGGSSPPSSASCLPVEVPSLSGSRLGSEPLEPSPPSSHSSLPSTTTTNASFSASTPASAAASFTLEEGGDSLSESANHMLPPPTASLGNLSSLDITNDEDLPTDPSNSSDTQEESEVEAFCADLSGRLLINTAVRMSVDKLHDLLFSADTHFIQHLFSQRHFTDLSVGEWQQDGSSGNTSRVLSYTIALNNPLGPKTAPVVETQTLQKSSARGECYVVDSEVITSGIPYQDYFYTVHRYCLTSINKHKSRLRVSSDICYKKQPWSLVKALIEKNTWSGIEEYYKHMESEVCKLETLLQTEVTVMTTGEAVGTDAAKTPPGLRRRKRTCSRRQGDREREREGGGAGGGDRGDRGVGEERDTREAGSQFMKLGERSRGGGHNSISTILLIVSFMICISLVVLVALNMLLFYKLYALERAAHTLETWHSYSVADSPLPQTAGEWAQVLQLQRQFHQAQLSKWQQILQSSVSLLDQMKQSLEKLHQGIVVPEVKQDPPADAESLTEA
ncbi:GRAM domain-containing protein 1A isoform X3 [Pundamilia nyererei]|uniref:GRAM domain-containing protein 1A isoform X3 n=1 Tax=Pundamilia nyererei TaxID=303518 RepID=A0A9Y6SQ38_9CICH|nr:PREDICTED: GRAM domain-containing protein 1A isoform X3 [Pundamilia nyererei]